MIFLAGFFDVLFRGFVFLGLALSIGGIVFYYVVLRHGLESEARDQAVRRTAAWIAAGAAGGAISQLLALVITPWSLADDTGRWPLTEFLTTTFAQAGGLRILFGLGLAGVAMRLRSHPRGRVAWALAAALGALVMIVGAWLVHGTGRLDHRVALMAASVLHQTVTVTWVGGTIHLAAQWRHLRKSARGEELWLRMPARFSPLAMSCVSVLSLAGIYLFWQYVHGWGGLIGTAYGTMLLTKVTLMMCALVLGGLNFLTIRRSKQSGDRSGISRRLPVFVETEAGIGIIILMTAAAFTGQPPAVDIPVADRSPPREVLHVFAPKKPQLAPVSVAELNAAAAPLWDRYSRPTNLDKLESDFIHNISGLFVIFIGLLALIRAVSSARWARHWPLAFIPFAGFLLVFAQPTGWPLGNRGLLESLTSPETLEHRMGTLLPAALGICEWRVQAGGLATSRWRYLFPALCGLGGVLLLSHSHSVFSDKPTFLIEASHNALGILAVMVGAGRWLQLRAEGRVGQVAGALWPVCFVMLGWVLVVYQEV